jgi:CRISPR-associated Csx2 family protein
MPYTLISFIGTGMYSKEGGYRYTKYQYPDGNVIESNIFVTTIFKKKDKQIEKLVLVGTETSAWDLLIDLNIEENTFLWEKIIEKKGICNEDIILLEKILSLQFSVPVIIKYHTSKIDTDTTEEVFSCYKSITSHIDEKSDILLDITHGFRSMPILLYQALQFSLTNGNPLRKVEIIYGEYKPEATISYVRNLSSYWDYNQITDAVSLFNDKLDGYRLSEIIKSEWESGSKVIKRISDIIRTNFALQILDVMRQISNSLTNFPNNASSWIDEVKILLEAILLLKDHNDAKTLYNYAVFLYEKKLTIQAIITLQLTVETAIAKEFGDDTSLGNYDWWQEEGKKILMEIKQKHPVIRKELNNLEYFRNQIAHGGAKDKYTQNFPSTANIPSMYENGKKAVKVLIKILEENGNA